MKVVKFFAYLLILLLCGCQTITQEFLLPNEGVRPREFKVVKHEDRSLITSDNISLVSDIYRPILNKSVPTILVRIPFTDTFPNRLRSDAVARYWATRGYNVVIQGTRGRYKSQGDYYPLINERRDGIETLQWLNKQQWFNGQLGMWGGSTFAYTQLAISDHVNPHISAYHMHIASTSFYDMFYPGGAFSFESALRWSLQSSGKKDIEPKIKDMEKGFWGFPLINADARADKDIQFFNDWVLNNTNNKYWVNIDGIDRTKSINAPVQMLAGWFDPFLPSQLNDFMQLKESNYKTVSTQSEIIIGPWSHAREVKIPGVKKVPTYRETSIKEGLHWFDKQLLKLRNEKTNYGKIKLFVLGTNKWRYENEWPLARTKYRNLYISSDGSANISTSSGELNWDNQKRNGFDLYEYNPNDPVPSKGGIVLGPRTGIALQNEIEERNDVLVYTSDVLESDLELTGPISATLYVQTDAINTDFVVRITDVNETGESYNVSDGVLRSNYSPANKSCDTAKKIQIHLWPTSYVFKSGHRLRVHITSSSFPRFDRNPNTGNEIPYETSFISAKQRVCFGANHPSHIRVPVIEN